MGGHLSTAQTAMKYVIGKRGGYTTTSRLQNVGAVTAKKMDKIKKKEEFENVSFVGSLTMNTCLELI